MDLNDEIAKLDLTALKVIHYPDPCLSRTSLPLPRVGPEIAALADRMFELMFAARGVGLAAPQVGINARMFVASPSFEPEDRRVYVNPRLIEVDGTQEGEEGCLSFPNISVRIKRYNFAVIEAMNLQGEVFRETGEELLARIFQHETDHLDGTLLVTRMGSVAKLANRRALKQLEEEYATK